LHYRFVPDGSDERQYSSPGFRIPVASITKDKYYEFPEYHTSLDNLEFVSGAQVYESLTVYEDAIRIVDENCLIRTRVPNGEAQLGRRGLYPKVGGAIGQSVAFGDEQDNQQAQLDLIGWVLFLADGNHDLIAVAERSKHRFEAVQSCVARLLEQDLIELIPSSQAASTVRVN
jgi:aminopeptidase-like protein